MHEVMVNCLGGLSLTRKSVTLSCLPWTYNNNTHKLETQTCCLLSQGDPIPVGQVALKFFFDIGICMYHFRLHALLL